VSAHLLLVSLASTASVAASSAASIASTVASAPTGLAAIVESTVPSAVASVLPSIATTTAPVTSGSPLTIPLSLEVGATFAGALAGALVGVERKFDIVGIGTLAIVSGLGGGMIRDVLLQKYGIYALMYPRLLIACLIAALIGFFFFTAAKAVRPLLFLFDALSLGLFCVTGADKALLAGLTFLPAILLGSITSVGGGVLRDLLTDQVPHVLRPGRFFALASVTGATLYVALVGWLNIVKPLAMVVVVLVVLILRVGSQMLGWVTPEPVDLTDAVAKAPGRFGRASGRAAARFVAAISGGGKNAHADNAAQAAETEHDNVEPGTDVQPPVQPPASEDDP
jgi:uncharacterized membrane protein YeiH